MAASEDVAAELAPVEAAPETPETVVPVEVAAPVGVTLDVVSIGVLVK